MRCKHKFHYVSIYYKTPFSILKGKFIEKRYASFICEHCGLLKEIEVKTE